MDEDLYEALFEDEGDDGSKKFEQLDDDFVVQVCVTIDCRGFLIYYNFLTLLDSSTYTSHFITRR